MSLFQICYLILWILYTTMTVMWIRERRKVNRLKRALNEIYGAYAHIPEASWRAARIAESDAKVVGIPGDVTSAPMPWWTCKGCGRKYPSNNADPYYSSEYCKVECIVKPHQ